MAAADAQLFWLSAKVPNDQFLLYCFDGAPDIAAGVDQLRRAAAGIADLRIRVSDDRTWRWPRWVPAEVSDEQFVVHPPDRIDALPGLPRLDATRAAWRVHVFPPGIVVVQVAHALGDGTRSAALAAALLGRRAEIPAVRPPDRGFLPWRAFLAARADRDTPPPRPPRPALSVNARPTGTPVLRTLLVGRDRLRQPSVTVGALVAIAEALGGYLAARGEDVSRLGAEVPVAGPPALARNNFRTVNVDLHPDLDRAERADRIVGDLALARGRDRAWAASAAAVESVPPALLRWGVGRFDPDARWPAVAGHTVVSSVNRGPADLGFGGSRVLFTAGYPALSPMMSLTHGVHGIGEAVAVSVHADPERIDLDDYVDRLAAALGVPGPRRKCAQSGQPGEITP